jgi:hypothetical protein
MKTRARIAAISLPLAGVLVGCSSLAAPSLGASTPGASTPQSRASHPGVSPTVHVFTSRIYGYAVALPADWSAQPDQHWGGIGAPGPVDAFRGQPYVAVWAFAVPRPARPVVYATAITRTAAQLPCPAAPEISQAVTIGGTPAWLIGMRCPARGGVLMLTALTTGGSALVVMFEDVSGIMSAGRPDRAAFRELLADIRLKA